MGFQHMSPEDRKKVSSKGGKKGSTGGFYANRELAKIAGSKGGKNRWANLSTKEEKTDLQ